MKKIYSIIFVITIFFIIGPNVSAKSYYQEYGTIYTKTFVDENTFGNSTKIDEGTYDKIKKIKEDNYKNSYINLDKYLYAIYKYDKVSNACVYQYNSYEYVAKGNVKEISFTINKTETTTYETSMELSMSSSIGKSSEVLGALDFTKVTFLVDTSLSTAVSKKIRVEKNFTHQTGLAIKDTLYAIDSDKYYAYEVRGNFIVYLVKVFEIKYDTEVKTKKTAYGKKYKTYNYTASRLDEVGYFMKYEYIENTSAIGFYPYEMISNGAYRYAGEKVDNIVYLD